MFLIRKLHKWVGLILGLQFILWSFSGAMMALLDSDKVSGATSVREPAAVVIPGAVLPLAQVAERIGQPITSLRLKPLGSAYVYQAATPTGVRLIDAVTGAPLAIDAGRASALATESFSGAQAIASVRRVTEGDVETRKLPLPLWRVEFADPEKTTLLLSEATGEVLERRTDTWRVWDVFWMIHIMDYTKRESFNHPLIITVATGILWLAISGLILLFRAFRPSDFSYVTEPIARTRAAIAALRP
ncbi:hypothetical protein BH10PSE2_BH10PSE2_03680 [soil metagenome]